MTDSSTTSRATARESGDSDGREPAAALAGAPGGPPDPHTAADQEGGGPTRESTYELAARGYARRTPDGEELEPTEITRAAMTAWLSTLATAEAPISASPWIRWACLADPTKWGGKWTPPFLVNRTPLGRGPRGGAGRRSPGPTRRLDISRVPATGPFQGDRRTSLPLRSGSRCGGQLRPGG